MSVSFNFNKQIQNDMVSILSDLNINKATKLEFSSKNKATKFGTNLIKVDEKVVNSNYKFSFPAGDNIYFLFDENFKCQYVGKKANKKGINYRLKLHLLKNGTKKTKSAINSVCKYLNDINGRNRVIYVITFNIEPSYMAEATESYFIDYFKNKGLAEWVLRK
ncbi:hypothetical protein [Clostridium perfringens]|uniref:hypothetical protein n=1 Tax=Clostridium perfringens TaxID=1502 RepID=UPI001A1C6152|nr:GIY-YIG nuclease family protein [Clostridium perfringens]